MTNENKKVDSLFDKVGSEKKSTLRRRIEKKLSDKVEVNSDIKKLCRISMRFPDKDVVDQLHVLHSKMKEHFLDMPDGAIHWLLGGSSEMSRGGFQDHSNITAVEKFKQFLNKDPKNIPVQKLLTSIETISTAMGYRAIHASWVNPPFSPETEEQLRMDKKIQSIMKDKLTQPIGNIYKERGDDSLDPLKPTTQEKVYGEQEDVSSASECEEEDQKPRKKIDRRIFRKNVDKNTLSWIGEAEEIGIQIRGHTSGTGPLVMSAIDGLCSSGKNPDNWLANDDNFKKLAGCLVISTFQRGDYHSLAETSAGINHYLNERAKRENKPMKPFDAFKDGLNMLKNSCSDSPLEKEDKISIKDAVAWKCQEIETKVTKLENKKLKNKEFMNNLKKELKEIRNEDESKFKNYFNKH